MGSGRAPECMGKAGDPDPMTSPLYLGPEFYIHGVRQQWLLVTV